MTPVNSPTVDATADSLRPHVATRGDTAEQETFRCRATMAALVAPLIHFILNMCISE
jgi:hypothetical protein